MAVSDKIKNFAKEKGVSLLWISERIGMTKQGFYSMLNNNSVKVETLEKIAELLDLPISIFFSEEIEHIKSVSEKSMLDATELMELLGMYLLISNSTLRRISKFVKEKDVSIDQINIELNKALPLLDRAENVILKMLLRKLSKEDITELIKNAVSLFNMNEFDEKEMQEIAENFSKK